jgi:hypothetical protein
MEALTVVGLNTNEATAREDDDDDSKTFKIAPQSSGQRIERQEVRGDWGGKGAVNGGGFLELILAIAPPSWHIMVFSVQELQG